MQYIKRFLAPAPSAPLPYTTKEDETRDDTLPGSEDLHHMTKAEVWQFFNTSVSEMYKGQKTAEVVIRDVLEEVNTPADIDEKVAQLERMHQILTHGLSLEVMDHYDQLVTGFQNLTLMQESIANGSSAAHKSRELLVTVKGKVEREVLRLIRLKIRAETLAKLSTEFDQFAEICYSISLSIKQATKKGEMYHALELCKAATQRLTEIDYKRFEVLRTIATNVEKKAGKVFGKVKARLAQLCKVFEPDIYENVLLAYASAYDSSQIALNIQAEFMNAVSHSFKSSIEKRLPTEVGKLQLQSVVHLLPAVVYPEAVRDIYRTMTQLLYNNHLFSRWHLDNDLSTGKGCQITQSFVSDQKSLSKLTESYSFVQDDLLRNRKYLWEKMQQKCATLFEFSEQFLLLQTAEITKILTWTDTFLQIGEDFSGAFSSELRNAVEKKVGAYFERVEIQTWMSLMTYLESEQWTRLPVPRNFDIDHMVTSGLKSSGKLLSALVSDHFSSSFSALVLSRPFEDEEAEEEFVGISATAPTGLYEESPVLCTSAYHLVRSLVTMAGLVRTFTPISFKIFFSMTRLVDLFIYVVYFRFVLKQDKDRLLQHLDPEAPGLLSLEKAYDLHLFQSCYQSLRVAVVRTKDLLDSKSESKSWLSDESQIASSPSVSESVIAINSCKLVLSTLVALQSYICEALPDDTQDFLSKYYEEGGAALRELDGLVSRAVSYKLNKGEWLVKTISEKPWDAHSAQASSYVNIILQYLEDVKERLINSPLPEKLKNEVMGQSIRHCIEQMMEGFSKVRVCSLSGRQQMLTDLKAFHSSVEIYSVPLPDLSTDLEYLQVWASPGAKALEWTLAHPKVPLRHHRNLLETNKDLQNQPSAARKAILDRLETEFRRMLRESLEG